jgi:polyferredoxin
VIRDRNSLFRETQSGLIENIYRLRVLNIDNQPHIYDVTATGIEGLQLNKDRKIAVEPGGVMTLPVRLGVNPKQLKKRSTQIEFQLTARENSTITITEEARFLGPFQ